jgi:hypothetical protein
MTILYEPEIPTAGHYEPEISTAGHYEITANHCEITASHYEFKNGASLRAIMDRIKMAYISNNKCQLFLMCVCVDHRSALAFTLLQMHTSLCTGRATCDLYEQTRDGRRRTSIEQSEAKIGQIR